MGNGQKKLLIASLIDANTNLDELEELEKISLTEKSNYKKKDDNMEITLGPFYTCFL